MAARSRGFMAGSGVPSFAATVISRASLPNSFDFGVLPALAVHDVLELGMAGHGRVSLELRSMGAESAAL